LALGRYLKDLQGAEFGWDLGARIVPRGLGEFGCAVDATASCVLLNLCDRNCTFGNPLGATHQENLTLTALA
jgi:hypothetical protein